MFLVQRERIVRVLEAWGSMMWTSSRNTRADEKWALSFSVFLSMGQGYWFCEGRIKNHGHEARVERRKFQELVRLTQAELFERCKEIFHSSFKTRKNGKEACNPIRDGLLAFKNQEVKVPIAEFVNDLRRIAREFGEFAPSWLLHCSGLTAVGREIKSHRASLPEAGEEDEPYLDAARLSCIFLDDFLDH
jgi:hypothetical protein